MFTSTSVGNRGWTNMFDRAAVEEFQKHVEVGVFGIT